RQKFDPAQDLQSNLGKIVRLRDDGSVPGDNPFAERGGVAAEIWSLGHRNPLGLAFDAQGRLWNVEMGPRGGDELNLVRRGANYGYPLVSEGNHYSGRSIPDHATRPDLASPAMAWNPVISPSSLMFYDGDEFPDWRGSAFIGGLSSQSLVRVVFDGERAREAERFAMGQRIREVEQGPDGAIWVLEDCRRGSAGRLLRLSAGSGAAGTKRWAWRVARTNGADAVPALLSSDGPGVQGAAAPPASPGGPAKMRSASPGARKGPQTKHSGAGCLAKPA